MRQWIALMLVISMTLAGCASSDEKSTEPTQDTGTDPGTDPGQDPGDDPGEDPGTGQEDHEDEPSDDPGDDSENEPDSNQPPTLNATSNIATGTVPFDVEITLAGEDPDGDALSWSLTDAAGDEIGTGTALPSTVPVNITEAGEYTFLARLSDGESEVTQMINITAVDAPDPELWLASWPASGATCGTPVLTKGSATMDCQKTYQPFNGITMAAGAGPTVTYTFTSDSQSNGYTAGTAIAIDINVAYIGAHASHPDWTEVTGTIKAGEIAVATFSQELDTAPSGVDIVPISWSGTLDEGYGPTDQLTLEFSIQTVGYMELDSATVSLG